MKFPLSVINGPTFLTPSLRIGFPPNFFNLREITGEAKGKTSIGIG